jgi:DNA-binding transcriptional ArsR family regulator
MAGIPNNRFVIRERREQVAILLSQSITELEIAKRLKVDQSTISRDVNAIKKESQQILHEITKETLPYEYAKCLTSLGMVIKECWKIFEDNSNRWSNKDKINALRLVSEAVTKKFEVLADGPITFEVRQFSEKLIELVRANELKSQELENQRLMLRSQIDTTNPPPF